jgi:ADP-heptose:LPS heptosyltransferase
MAQNKSEVEIVVARFSALGDVAMCIPVLYSVCVSYPGIDFKFVTRKAYTSLFINKPSNLEVMGVDLKKEYKGILGMRRLSRDLGTPDTFIDLHDVLRTRLLGSLLKLKGVRVITFDKGRKYKKRLVTNGAMTMSPLKSNMQRYDEAFLEVPLRRTTPFAGLFVEHPANESLYASVSAPKAADERWIGIAPFAAHPGKIYPLDKMQIVLDELAQHPDNKIFLFGGGEDEIATLTAWAAKYNNVVCVAGKNIGFAAELSLMHHLDVMLSMDSGNMHLAAIAGTRVVSIWGATHPSAGFVAWRTNTADCLGVQLSCRPCSIFGNKPCRYGTLGCMHAIYPKDIIAHINTILS